VITFSEGLPRSGKSFEAVSIYIAEALKKGREVVAYVEGIGDPEKMAKLSLAIDVPLAVIRELLHPLTREQVREVMKHARRNALHVIDEAQNFWGNKAKLDEQFTQFVAEHGHRGEDWLLMGQDLRDVHVLWRRRVEIRRRYLKLAALGLENRYAVTTERNVGPDQFEAVGQSITNKYDERFFGTYKSHVDQDVQTGNFKDFRATVWSKPALVIGVPLALVMAVVGGYVFFKGISDPAGMMLAKPSAVPASAASASIGGWGPLGPPGALAAPSVAPVPAPAPATPAASSVVAEKKVLPLQEEFLRDALSFQGARLRYAGFLSAGTRSAGVVEVRDASYRIREVFTLDQLRAMGVDVFVHDGYVHIVAGDFARFVTQWPLDPPEGQVPGKLRNEVASASDASAPVGLVAIGNSGAPALVAAPSRDLDDGPPPSRPRVKRPADL
jgi:zona occludens toxin